MHRNIAKNLTVTVSSSTVHSFIWLYYMGFIFWSRPGPILENKGMGAIFQKKDKEMLAKYLRFWAKM